MTRELAISLCTEFERVLAMEGWHVGLTGSCLYGVRCSDLDLIIYPHIYGDGVKSELTPEQVLALVGITEIKHTAAEQWYGEGHVNYIYVGKHKSGIKIDAFSSLEYYERRRTQRSSPTRTPHRLAQIRGLWRAWEAG